MRDIKYLVVHCTAGPQTQKVEDIQAYWRKKLGWKSPGYHVIVRADGSVEELEDISNPTNGVAGHNKNSIHISYIGGVDKNGKAVDNRTPQQKATILKYLRYWRSLFPEAKIQGHRDFSPDLNKNGKIEPNEFIKMCPSFSAIEEYQSI